eukprot:2377233-Pleurochrysis_carterae.AAC.1
MTEGWRGGRARGPPDPDTRPDLVREGPRPAAIIGAPRPTSCNDQYQRELSLQKSLYKEQNTLWQRVAEGDILCKCGVAAVE